MTTPYLEGTELANGQVDQYLTANALVRRLEQAVAGRRTINFASDANYTLVTTAGSEQWLDCFLTFTDTASPHVLTAGRDVIFPAKSGPIYLVKNSTAKTLTVKITGQTGEALPSGSIGLFYYDGTDIVAIASGGGATATIITPAGTTHTATLANNGGLVVFNSASDCTLTVPQTSTEALDAGYHLLAINIGGGNLKIAKQGSDTLEGISLSADPTQPITIIKRVAGSPNTWRIIGNIWAPTIVLDDALTAPPATPAVGAVYIPAATATGSWATHENDFAIHIGSDAYEFAEPAGVVYESTSAVWRGWTGSAWANV